MLLEFREHNAEGFVGCVVVGSYARLFPGEAPLADHSDGSADDVGAFGSIRASFEMPDDGVPIFEVNSNGSVNESFGFHEVIVLLPEAKKGEPKLPEVPYSA